MRKKTYRIPKSLRSALRKKIQAPCLCSKSRHQQNWSEIAVKDMLCGAKIRSTFMKECRVTLCVAFSRDAGASSPLARGVGHHLHQQLCPGPPSRRHPRHLTTPCGAGLAGLGKVVGTYLLPSTRSQLASRLSYVVVCTTLLGESRPFRKVSNIATS